MPLLPCYFALPAGKYRPVYEEWPLGLIIRCYPAKGKESAKFDACIKVEKMYINEKTPGLEVLVPKKANGKPEDTRWSLKGSANQWAHDIAEGYNVTLKGLRDNLQLLVDAGVVISDYAKDAAAMEALLARLRTSRAVAGAVKPPACKARWDELAPVGEVAAVVKELVTKGTRKGEFDLRLRWFTHEEMASAVREGRVHKR